MTLREAVKPLARHLGVAASDLYRLAVATRAPVGRRNVSSRRIVVVGSIEGMLCKV